jgi:hypothetical protein
MNKRVIYIAVSIALILSCALFFSRSPIKLPEDVATEYAGLEEDIDFNRDVKKILSDKCFTCHGPDAKKQKADLRLDLADFAYEHVSESGLKAIKPGSISRSELVRRILSEDPEYRMPTPESHLTLTPREKAILIKWIDEGAEYKPHWAFVAPQKEKEPEVQHEEWVGNTIDRFIVNKLEKKGMKPAREADRATLIRRLSFDIRGIAPSLQEVDAFLASKDPKAYEKLVESFLASKHYGERMAAYWLDLARFADSHGYLDDKHHEVSPWRDWVVSAFNRNIPFDQFVTWQMAGDLIPKATKEQVLATGFNRMHKQNSEAGIIEEEFRVEYVVDRTNTLGTALMAMTLGCAKCHDHKYDPISQKDYYSLYAFFNNTFEKGSPNYGGPDVVAGPTLRLTSDADDKKISLLSKQIANLEKIEASKIKEQTKQWDMASEKTIAANLSGKLVAKLDFDKTRKQKDKEYFVNATGSKLDAVFRKAEQGQGVDGKSLLYNDQTVVAFEPYNIAYFERYDPFSFSFWIKVPENYPLATVFHASDPHRYGYQGYDLVIKENRLNFRLSHDFPHDAVSVFAKQRLVPNQWYHVAISYTGSSKASGVGIYLNGKQVETETEYDNLFKNIRSYPNIHKTSRYNGLVFGKRDLDRSMPGGQIDEFHVFSNVLFPAEVQHLYQKKSFDPRGEKKKTDSTALMLARKSLCDLYDSTKEVMVMGDLPKPRKAHVLLRGIYSSYGDPVEPSTPAAILPFDKKYPKNRLGLSMWLFDERNPLTARVAVNRIWQLIFGKGLVKTSDDFGNQGEIPLQQDLLDHLAIWYRENGWDTKALMRYIFTSNAYRQSSLTEASIEKEDPNNEYYSRNPRYRFPAEMIRDNALSIAGLLSQKIGGPSVYPYQPEGLWDELSDKGWRYRYVVSEGEDRFRKSIYTVRKRTSVVPFLQIFDAPDRSVCTVKRQKSSSPMQSLAMLNDPQMIEAARFVGLRMLEEGGQDVDLKLLFGFRLITGRKPGPKELALLKKMHEAEIKNFSQYPEKAEAYLGVGTLRTDYQDRRSLATMSTIALAIMNTDEYLTRK